MNTTLKNLNHEKLGRSESSFQDLSALVASLQLVAKAFAKSVDRPIADLKVPFPEIHNNIEVVPTPIEIQSPKLENKVYVNPTPIEVNVAPAKVDFKVDSPEINISLTPLVTAVYVLSGVIGVSFAGLIGSLLMR